ncbi:hypothetical protein EBU95_20480 [bacterium]|nr:hypothetical protein [bacterium]
MLLKASPENALPIICITPLGIKIPVKAYVFIKAFPLMPVTLLEIVTDLSRVARSKAPSPIVLTVAGTV